MSETADIYSPFICYNMNATLNALLRSNGILVDDNLRKKIIYEIDYFRDKAGIYMYQYYFDTQIEEFERNDPELKDLVRNLDETKVNLSMIVGPVYQRGPIFITKAIFNNVLSVDNPGTGSERYYVDQNKVRNYFGDNADRVQPILDKFLQDNGPNAARKKKPFEYLYQELEGYIDISPIVDYNKKNEDLIKSLYKSYNAVLIRNNLIGVQGITFDGSYQDSINKIDSLDDTKFISSREDLKEKLVNENDDDYLYQLNLTEYLIKKFKSPDLEKIIKDKIKDFKVVLDYIKVKNEYDKFSEIEDVPILDKTRIKFTYDHKCLDSSELKVITDMMKTNSPELKYDIKSKYLRWRDIFDHSAYILDEMNHDKYPRKDSLEKFMNYMKNFPKNKENAAKAVGDKLASDLNKIAPFRQLIQALNQTIGYKIPELTTKYVRPVSIEDRIDCMLKYAFSVFTFYSIEKQISTYLEGFLEQNLRNIHDIDDNFVYTTDNEGGSPKWKGYKQLHVWWNVNRLATKRWSSGIHTFKSGTDCMSVMVSEPGCAMAYFDISACEVRMAAKCSGDEQFQYLFDSGQDPYIFLVKKAFPNRADDSAFIKGYRSYFKTVVLGILYGRGARSIAENTGLTVDQAKHLIDAFFEGFPKVKPWIESKQRYAAEHGYIDSFFGDKITVEPSRAHTAGINYFVQNVSSVCLAEGFGNMILKSKFNGRPMNARIIVHDSSTVSFYLKDLLKIYDDIHENFYNYVLNKYGVKFKYDLIIHPLNHRDKVEFSYDKEEGKIKVHGFKDSVDYLRNNFIENYDFQELFYKEIKPAQSVYENAFLELETPKIQKFHIDNNMYIPAIIDAEWIVKIK